MPYVDTPPHSGSVEQLQTGMYDEPAGTIARTLPRRAVSIGTLSVLTTNGQTPCNGIPLAQGSVITNIGILTGGTAANGPTHFWMGLLDPGMNVLAVTADQGAAAIPAATQFVLPLTLRTVIAYTGLYYIVVSVTASTTAPTLAGATLAAGIAGTLLPTICGTTGLLSLPPAIGAQLGGGNLTSNAAACFAAWLS